MEGRSHISLWNPFDVLITPRIQLQDWAPDFIKYPHVFGSDGAGTVVKIGSDVTRFKVGDRVMGYATYIVDLT